MTDAANRNSLDDMQRTVPVAGRNWWRRLLAFVGPAYMVSVGYMDPGNWATDIAGGAQFGYSLLWVLLMSNAMAVLLQTLSARLGLVTGRDLAQACRDEYGNFVRYVLFVLCEIAIAACDLAEVLGSAVGLNLLLGIPILWAVIITGFDVMLLLVIQRFGVRKMEAFILLLVMSVGACFLVEIFLSRPDAGGIIAGLVPRPMTNAQLYIAIGIIGATVMPHNLYLHSSLVQSRDVARNRTSVREAARFNLVDSVIAMNGAFFVNAAILIVAAAVFWRKGVVVEDLGQASEMLRHLLGSDVARIAFAVALLCAGQSSTVTGTLAGQITMEGFLHFRMRPWLRRLITRLAAITPAVVVILSAGERAVFDLLIFSQVVLSLQLPFAVVPLLRFTGSRRKMGPFVSPPVVKALAWAVAAIIIALNVKLLLDAVASWASDPRSAWVTYVTAAPVGVALGVLLLWMTFRREQGGQERHGASAHEVARAAADLQQKFRRIGVALEAKPSDSVMLSEAIALAQSHGAELVLMHVVEGVGGQWYGSQTGDLESREDQAYVEELARRLEEDLRPLGVPRVAGVLGYGDVPRQLIRLAQRQRVDLMVVGGHGHRGIADILHGTTISGVRHGLGIPILSVR